MAKTAITVIPLKVRNTADEIKIYDETHSLDVVTLETITPQSHPKLWDTLDLPSEYGDSAYHSVFVHYEKEIPFQVEERFVNPQLVPYYIDQDFHQIAASTYLMNSFPDYYGKHYIDAIVPTQNQLELLQLKDSSPCLRIQRTTYSQDQLLSKTILLHPGQRITLEGEFGK